MFDPVDPKQSFPDLETGILKFWREEDTFQRSLHARTKRDDDPFDDKNEATESSFHFYDGPPFATGLPHYGHLLAGTIKDVIPRYQTMRGKRVERRFGWDCHGLPVEYEIEKEHKIGSRQDIEKMGVAAFNALCRGTVLRYTKEWRNTVERMGRWVDMDWDYRTMDPEFMESIWWVFHSLHEKGLIYEGHKPMHVCPRCQTPLSNFEVTQGYKDVTDQTATAQFELNDEPNTFVLAWTTTPWTLPGNLFLAVNPTVTYVAVSARGQTFILAKDRVADVFKKEEHAVIREMSAKDLIGKTYKPLFPYFAEQYGDSVFRIVAGDFVTTEDGTGVVHIAPGFGEDDFNVGKREGVPLLQHVGIDGRFVKQVTDFAGQDVKPKDDPSKMDKKLIEWLKSQNKLFTQESYRHSYPHCWRCDSPLLNYATSSWFVAVEKIKAQMLKANAKTNWVPDHIRDGRFGRWLEGARDWAISRNRYWGTPLPIWRNSLTGDIEVIGSREELVKKAPKRFTTVTVLRHGESEGNVVPKYQGELPGTDLTKKGKTQAKAAGTFLKESNVAHVYASPLARTQQTAAIVAKETKADVTTDDRLREVRFGEYEGKTVDFSDLAFVKARRAHKLETQQVESIYHFPGMETWGEVHGRVTAFLQEILSKHRGEHIVLVTHADLVLNIKHFFQGTEPAKLYEQPYPTFAEPVTFYWDHHTGAQLDLHKEHIDELTWESDEGPVTEVTFVRHGEIDPNVQEMLPPDPEVSLNAKGREQARALGKKLKGEHFDVLISSSRRRAVETAEILSEELGIPLSDKWDLLRERDWGSWCGMTYQEVREKYPSPNGTTLPGFNEATPDGGESLDAIRRRAADAVAKLQAEFPGKRVLVVSHSAFLRVIRTHVEGLSVREGVALTGINNAETLTYKLKPRFRRIPDVLDCWFESGSMPYAQIHYPFHPRFHLKGKKKVSPPPTFPADFIAEGIDQTRGWFYTLTVLGTALFGQSPFKNVIVNGTVLAEDGKKMSKRLKNYPEPLAVANKHGADAVRFALMSSPAVRGDDLRFSEKTVEECLRNVLLPYWNTYAFFVTYANAAGWKPQETRAHSSHPLDVWIRAEVQDLVNRMTEQMERYDLSATCGELLETIDALTNWYVRLSRRRFAGKAGMHDDIGSGQEGDRIDALNTLYDVLLTLSQVLAPFTPFITEAVYLNLAPTPHGSVHITDWPETRELKKGEQSLLSATRLLRTIVSLGLKVRADAKIKVRQPLAKAVVAVPASLRVHELSGEEISLLREELNVKEIEMVDDPGSLAQAIVQVDARKVGPRLGGKVQEVIQAGKRGEFEQKKNGSVVILGETLSAEEAKLVYVGVGGANVAADRGVVVSLDTTVTPALETEGLARDLIRAVQQLRKDAGLSFTDTISLSIAGVDDIVSAASAMITEETGSILADNDGESHDVLLGNRTATIRFRKR